MALVNDDEAEVAEESLEGGVHGQHAHVDHVRIGDEELGTRADAGTVPATHGSN